MARDDRAVEEAAELPEPDGAPGKPGKTLTETEKRRRKTMEVMRIAELAKAQIAQATGLEPQVVMGAEHDTEGWHITVEMVEVHRIPEVHNVIGMYEVRLDDEGTLLSWRRSSLRRRGDLEGGTE